MQDNMKIKSLIFQIQTIIFCPEWAELNFIHKTFNYFNILLRY